MSNSYKAGGGGHKGANGVRSTYLGQIFLYFWGGSNGC